MNVRGRISDKLYNKILLDLKRPHEFAAERIGFLYAKIGNRAHSSHAILNFTEYVPVHDSQYLNDPRVGALINSDAIRTALQHCISTKQGAFHVHMHEHFGTPGFSRTDLREQPKLIPSLKAVQPDQAHGMVLFSNDEMVAKVWLPTESNPIAVSRISIVGFPMRFFGGNN